MSADELVKKGIFLGDEGQNMAPIAQIGRNMFSLDGTLHPRSSLQLWPCVARNDRQKPKLVVPSHGNTY